MVSVKKIKSENLTAATAKRALLKTGILLKIFTIGIRIQI